jgi:hypothetical protein
MASTIGKGGIKKRANPIPAPRGNPPVNTVAPVASGTVSLGQTLSVTTGTWTNSPLTYNYQWQRNGVDILGAAASSYVVVNADLGATIRCSVTAWNNDGPGNAYSNSLTLPATSLSALSGTFILAESAALGAVAGAITGKTLGSTLTVIDSAGGRVDISGTNVIRGLTGLDYETNTFHSFTIRETLAGAINSPRDTVLTLDVTDVLDTGGGGTTDLLLGFNTINSYYGSVNLI